jgi:hypothetical protein
MGEFPPLAGYGSPGQEFEEDSGQINPKPEGLLNGWSGWAEGREREGEGGVVLMLIVSDAYT